MNSSQLNRLLKNPKAMMDYTLRGRLPTSTKPSSPLITLLSSFDKRDLVYITNVEITHSLGYTGNRTFHNAAQALNWLTGNSACQNPVSESWRDKRFNKRLEISDLAKCASIPDPIKASWLRRHGRSDASNTPSESGPGL